MSTAQGSGPTVLRILLGSQLRQWREDQGITREAAGYEIRSSESKISRMELGRVSFKVRDVEDLLTMYGVTDEETREPLLTLARDANTPGWWKKYGDILPQWFESYVGLERAASLIRTYELQFVPGLLQTPDYADAVTRLGRIAASDEEIERRVSLRLTRQRLLTAHNAPKVWAVVDEAALHRPIGGPAVMRRQLEALIKAAEMPNVTVQVMPFRYGGHAAEGGAFTILRFAEQELPDVVYIEQLNGATYLDGPEETAPYMTAMDRLSVDSATPAHSREILHTILQST